MKDDLGTRLREALRRMLLVFDQGNDLNGGAEQDTCTFARRTLNAPRPPVPVGVMWCEPPTPWGHQLTEFTGDPKDWKP